MAFLTKLGEEEIADLERSLRLTASGLALPPQSYRFCTATNGVSALQGNAGLRVRVPAEHVACLVLRQVYLDVELLVEALLGPAGHFIETLIIAGRFVDQFLILHVCPFRKTYSLPSFCS